MTKSEQKKMFDLLVSAVYSRNRTACLADSTQSEYDRRYYARQVVNKSMQIHMLKSFVSHFAVQVDIYDSDIQKSTIVSVFVNNASYQERISKDIM